MNVCMVCLWFLEVVGNEEEVVKYFVVIFMNVDGVMDFGIVLENMFGFWDWVGGCYSLIFVIGLFIVCIIGFDYFW